MASSVINKKPCSRCGSKGWVLPCEGCQASFCVAHAGVHRIELTTQLDNIQQQYEHLQHIYNQYEKRQEHPLFSQIDVWENDTIAKMQQTAQTARDELSQLLNESNDRMKTTFKQFNDQLHAGRELEHFTEIELNQWKEQLINIRKQLETPSDMELITDNNLPPIHLIKVNLTKQNTLIKIPSFSQPTRTCDDTENIDCPCDDELDKPQSTVDDINQSSIIEVVVQNEPSTIPKEEPEIIFNLCETPPIESRILLDPTKTNNLLLLQFSPTIQEQFSPALNKLTSLHLQVCNREDDCLNELKHMEQATIFIDIFNVSLADRNHLLDNISELNNVPFMYIRGTPPENDDERDQFFRRYSRIKAMFESEQRLIVQWAIDTANEYKATGDVYIELGDKDKARICFEQGVDLYKHLSEFLNEKRRVR